MHDAARDPVPLAARAAGLQYVVLGVGFGVGAIVAIAALERQGQLPMTPWGFRAFEGRFARIGLTEPLLGAMVAVGALDAIAGAGLWRGRRWAGRLGLLVTPFALVLAIGFELPFLLIGIPARLAFLRAAWRRLR